MVWKTLDSHPLDVCSLHDVEYEVWGKIITPIGNWFRVSCSSYEKALFPLQYTADRKDGNSTYYAYRRHSVWLYRFSCTNFREYNRVFFLQHNHSFLLLHFCLLFSEKCSHLWNDNQDWYLYCFPANYHNGPFRSPRKYHLLFWIIESFLVRIVPDLLINFCWINLD